MKKAYINGNFVAPKDANISIFDRGLIFGDAVYEVIPVYHSKLYFLDKHIARLQASLHASRIPLPQCNWEELCQQLVDLNGGGNLQIYIQVTRGNQGVRKHDIPQGLTPTVIAYTLHTAFPTLDDKEKGLKACLLEDYRWLKCNIKSTSLLANILLNDEAVSQGANTAILLRDGYLTEGSTSNIFVVDKNNKVRTAPLNNLCLAGVTRQITIDLLEKLNIAVHEDPKITKNDILNAAEVWVTSTTKEIFPVSAVDGNIIGKSDTEKLWKSVDNLYSQSTSKC